MPVKKEIFRLGLAALCFAFVVNSSTVIAQTATHKGLGSPQGILALEEMFKTPVSVRNKMAQSGEEISILRYFKIKKGTYPEFHRRSVEGVWPYFEKIGSRVVGMWRVDQVSLNQGGHPDYDEVYLLTRYASIAHWKASRNFMKLGGNGDDAKALVDALSYRSSVTLETSFTILRGTIAHNGPYYMPGMEEAGK
jgi:hypothetical protein